jgi:mono/diheme cytochrome c family protein
MNIIQHLSTCLGTLWLSVLILEAAEADGKTVFLNSNCQLCHSVDTQGIPKTEGLKFEGGDLSTIGEKRKKPDWLVAYLKGEEKGKNGLKHNQVPFVNPSGQRLVVEGLPQTKFTASDEEFNVLAQWLTTLKKSKK